MSKTRKTPRISANKLAEYLTANSVRRKQIVKDSKYPSSFIVTRYKEARDIIRGFVNGDYTIKDVNNFIKDFQSKPTTSDFQENDRVSSILALEQLKKINISTLSGFTLEANDNYEDLLKINGVEISVFPDIFISQMKGVIKSSGALKIHITKDNALNEESQNIVGILLYLYSEKFLSTGTDVASTKLCFSLDVFKERLQCCPPSYKIRLGRIEAACEEIALWWDIL
nr:hypothetical protein [uncultured Pedobacter sp.]